jgi:hypothetical protein
MRRVSEDDRLVRRIMYLRKLNASLTKRLKTSRFCNKLRRCRLGAYFRRSHPVWRASFLRV